MYDSRYAITLSPIRVICRRLGARGSAHVRVGVVWMRDESEMSAGSTYQTSCGPHTSRIVAAVLGVVVGSGIVDEGGRGTSGRADEWTGRQEGG